MIDDIDNRLERDGQQWRANRPAGLPLDTAIRSLATSTRSRRWRTALVSAAAVLVVAVIAAGAIALRTQADSRTVATANGVHLPTCGTIPTARGPLSSRLALTLTAPAMARTGTTIKVAAHLRAVGATVRSFDAGVPADVLIVLNGQVVGRYEGSVGGTGLSGPVGRNPFTVRTNPVLLSGCSAGPIDYAHPNASRHPLPPGTYRLVAVLDSEGHRNSFQLVSQPSSIHITK